MKKILSFLLVAAGLVLAGQSLTSCSSCSGNKEQQEPVDPAKVFTHQDTVRVLELVDQFSLRLKEGDVKGAVEMLRFLNGDNVEELNPMFVQRQANALMHIAGKSSYEIDRIVFRDNIDNEAKVDITLFELEDENDKRPNKTSFYFRPVRMDGTWYLTTKDNITDTHSELRNNDERQNLPVITNRPHRNAPAATPNAPKDKK